MKPRVPLRANGPHSGFSLIEGDPLFELQRLAHLADRRHHVFARTLVVVLVGWLPAVVLGLLVHAERWAFIALHTRFLIAVPVLFWAERFVDLRVREAVISFPERGIVTGAELPKYDELVEEASRMRHSRRAAVMIVALSFGVAVFGDLSGHAPPGSAAEWWITYVSLPVFRVVLLQWVWRWIVWAILLFGIAQLELDLSPTHPDLAGGLGFLEPAAISFASLLVAAGVVLAARLASGHYALTNDLQSHSQLIIGFTLIGIVLVLGPLTFFSPHLVRAKRRGQLEHGAFASRHDRLFESRWRRDRTSDPLGDPSISSLADLGTSYGPVDRMRPIPLGRRSLIALAAICVAPVLPAVLTRVPLPEMLARAAKALLM